MAHALVLAAFSEAHVIGAALEVFATDGWEYQGFIPGPETMQGKAMGFGGLGASEATVDSHLYLVFSKADASEPPAALHSSMILQTRTYLATPETIEQTQALGSIGDLMGSLFGKPSDKNKRR